MPQVFSSILEILGGKTLDFGLLYVQRSQCKSCGDQSIFYKVLSVDHINLNFFLQDREFLKEEQLFLENLKKKRLNADWLFLKLLYSFIQIFYMPSTWQYIQFLNTFPYVVNPSVLHLLLNPSWFWVGFFINSACKEKEDIHTLLQIQQYGEDVECNQSSLRLPCLHTEFRQG